MIPDPMADLHEPCYRYRAEVLQVIDADTLRLRIDLGFRAAVTIEGRVRGIDAPELSTEEGKAAKAYVDDLLHPGAQVLVESYRNRRSFARWIVDVYNDDEWDLAEDLVQAGHAKRMP